MTVTFKVEKGTETKPCKILKNYPSFTLVEIKGKIGNYNKCFMNCDIGKTVKFND